MYNKISNNVGFYFLLLFALTITVLPALSYLLAVAITLIWLLDVLIFRDIELIGQPLFFPIIGFAVFSIIVLTISEICGGIYSLAFVGPLLMFSLIMPGFVISGEKRKMILWSFIAGVVLASGLDIISWWGETSGFAAAAYHPGLPLSFLVALAFCIVMAQYAQTENLLEKLFLGFISLPLACAAALSADRSAVLVLAFVILIIGAFKDRTVFIPLVAALFVVFSGVFGIGYYVEKNFNFQQYGQFAVSPIHEMKQDQKIIDEARFYGINSSLAVGGEELALDGPFFFDLIARSGPPSLILFLWIILAQAQGSFAKIRKTAPVEISSYHLSLLLALGAVIIMNVYGTAFQYPSNVLAISLLLGMAES